MYFKNLHSREQDCRGSAAVEMLLSVPFLFLFAVAMLHSTKIFRGQIKTQLAARHYAWSEGRAHDYVSANGAPPYTSTTTIPQENSTMWPAQARSTEAEFNTLHFGSPAAKATRSLSHYEKHLVALTIDAVEGTDASLGSVPNDEDTSAGGGKGGGIADFFSNLNAKFGRGVFGWVAGMQWINQAQVTYDMTGDSVGAFWVFTGKTVSTNHHVILYAGQEKNPSNPWGWLDLSELVKSALDGIF